MNRKSFDGPLEFKSAGDGSFRARIATLRDASGAPTVDKDGDAYGPGAFPVGKQVTISAYGHRSWEGALPVGVGTVGANETKAWVDGRFFLTASQGKDTYETVKALAERGLGEWSYGYEVLDSSTDWKELDAFAPGAKRIIKALDVFEASPVLVGAGVDTATEHIKAATAEMRGDPETLRHLDRVDVLMAQLDEAVDSLMTHLGEEEQEEIEGSAQDDRDDNLPYAPPKGEVDLEAIHDRLILSEVKASIDAAEDLINPPVPYLETSPRLVHEDQRRVAGETLLLAMAKFGLDGARIRWFTEVVDGDPWTFKASPLRGRVFKGEIWVNTNQHGEALAEVVLHEAIHLAYPNKGEGEVELLGIQARLNTVNARSIP